MTRRFWFVLSVALIVGYYLVGSALDGVIGAPRPVPARPGPVTETTTASGYQVIDWEFVANSSGAASSATTQAVYGILYRGFIEPDASNPSAGAVTITVRERLDYGGMARFTADLAGGLFNTTSNTNALTTVAFWPAAVRPVASRLQLDVTGATNAGGSGAQGRMTLIVGPYASQ